MCLNEAPLLVPRVGSLSDAPLCKEHKYMPKDMGAMRTVLRVLTAFIDKRFPDPADVEELGRIAPSVGGFAT
jgi:hypothetical protein